MEPMFKVSISQEDALDGLTGLVLVILSHMGAQSSTFIDTLRGNVDRNAGLSEASKEFQRTILLAAELSVKSFKGKADA